MTQANQENHQEQEWSLDSGASAHITKDSICLTNSIPKADITITTVSNMSFTTKLVGTSEIQITNGYEVQR